ncbi:MAG: hypothetical protein D6771_08565, partial [Zetaproteobacteria bacterium]
EEGKLYFVRDPFGVKPLYYAKNGEKFAFASEARVLRVLGFGASLDERSLRQFLTLRYVPSPDTLWDGIKRLPPGHVLAYEIGSGEMRLSPYLKFDVDRFDGDIREAADAYRGVLADAVKRQLLSDVPVGILLSGGIDSALVAAMAKDAGAEPPCFTVGFGRYHPECELAEAEETARVLGLSFHPIRVGADELWEALEKVVAAVEEPLGTTSVLPMWYLVQRARQGVTVVLTGQGSDEPWGGYFRYQAPLLGRFAPWPGVWKGLGRFFSSWQGMPEALERGLRMLRERDPASRIVEACALFPAKDRIALLGDADDGGAKEAVSRWLALVAREKGLDEAERMMRVDARMNLADDLLLYGDKISMAFSLEARVPMLDLEVVRFVESLPRAFRVQLWRGKVVHKFMAQRYLPARIVHRKKKGFRVPFAEWSRGIWRKKVEDRLFSEGIHLRLLNKQALWRIWQEHLQQKPDRSRQVFTLLMLAVWWEQQFGGGNSESM